MTVDAFSHTHTQTLGGINTSLYHTNKPIHYTKIVEERFFNVLLTDISVGDRKLNISCKEV